ncbi:hypothetical protein BKA65DRAFT_251439 [Rhexocercosporidium sp. MPI-PUGE-AT-0058]|nr:hypothetical protein BKA65DRAFT_251439 [Rhexocercosporidium sp. MPI-PUGE-AT-0058]
MKWGISQGCFPGILWISSWDISLCFIVFLGLRCSFYFSFIAMHMDAMVYWLLHVCVYGRGEWVLRALLAGQKERIRRRRVEWTVVGRGLGECRVFRPLGEMEVEVDRWTKSLQDFKCWHGAYFTFQDPTSNRIRSFQTSLLK